MILLLVFVSICSASSCVAYMAARRLDIDVANFLQIGAAIILSPLLLSVTREMLFNFNWDIALVFFGPCLSYALGLAALPRDCTSTPWTRISVLNTSIVLYSLILMSCSYISYGNWSDIQKIVGLSDPWEWWIGDLGALSWLVITPGLSPRVCRIAGELYGWLRRVESD